MFMMMASAASRRATCQRASVGAVITYQNRVISIGYNGPPAGEPHCFGETCPLDMFRTCVRSTHAEANAIQRIPEFIYRSDDEQMEFTLYVTHSPCEACAELIIGEIITSVYFETRYHNISGLRKLRRHGIKCVRITPSGYEHEQRFNEEQELHEVPVT